MLIEAPYKAPDAITLKLATSEELIARFVEEDEKTITITKPMVIMMTQSGQPGLGPFTFTVNPEAKLKINKHGVIFVVKSDEEMAKQYIESTTGIAL